MTETAAPPAALTKYYEFALEQGPCAPDEAIALLTTDRVDRDGEVVVPGGAVLDNFRRNPVVMYGHAKGIPAEGHAGLPVGKNRWIKPSRDGHGLIAKHAFDLDHGFSRDVCGKVKGGFLNTVSITFLPIESGPPTAAELKARPDWRGARTVYRKWELVEYSVVALPANVDAVTLAKRGNKMPEDADTAGAADTQTAGAETPPDPDAARGAPPDDVTKALPMPAEPDADDDDDAEEPAEKPKPKPEIKRGMTVKSSAPHFKGLGRVVSVHKGEMVPNVDEDMYGSEEEPAARVRAYKMTGGGHVLTNVHKGVLCKHLTPVDEPEKPTGPKPVSKPKAVHWGERERSAYIGARLADPAFADVVSARVKEFVEVHVLGRV